MNRVRCAPLLILSVLVLGTLFYAANLVPIPSAFAYPAAPRQNSVIDLEGLPEGSIVNSLSYGSGISGDPVSGEVAVFGFNPAFGLDTNAAMIFDSACLPPGTPAGCTGGTVTCFGRRPAMC